MSAVLVLRALGLGDFLTGVPAYRALRAAHPGREIVLAAPGALAPLVAGARLVVSGDTGLAHLAFAYARPSVTLYGPVSPRLWGPPADRRHRVIWHGTGVRPGDPHGRRPDRRLLLVGPREVLDAALADVAVR